MYQKLRKSHLRLRMKPPFVISLVYDLIFLIAAFSLCGGGKMRAETRIQKPAPAAPFPPHSGGQRHKAPHCRLSVSSVGQGCTALRRWVRVWAPYHHCSYTEGTSFQLILLCFLGHLCDDPPLCHLGEMAPSHRDFLPNRR